LKNAIFSELTDLNGTNLHGLRDYVLPLLLVTVITQMLISLILRLLFLVQLNYFDDDHLPLPCDGQSYHR